MSRDRRRRTTPVLLTAALAVAVLAGTAGCSGKGAEPVAVASHYSGESCDNFLDGTRQVTFTDEHGTRLSGVELGSGTTGLVLTHQDPGDVCDWLPYARELVNSTPGYRVLCLDFQGYGNSDDGAEGDRRDLNIVSAAGYLRDHGVAKVVLMGASMGGNASLVAATELQPPPAAVVSFSAPTYWKGIDAQAAVPKLAVPVLLVAGSLDNNGRFADAARALYAATPAGIDRRLVIASSTTHGVNLLSPVDADATHTRAALGEFLKAYAPPAS